MLGLLDEIAMPARPDDAGLRFRHYRGSSDLAGMAAANQAMRDAHGILDTTSLADLEVQYANLTNSDLDQDLVIVETAAGIGGYARVEWRDLTDGTRSFSSVIVLAPAVGTAAVARSMLAWCEARNVANARSLPEAGARPAVLQAFTIGTDRVLPEALEAAGWRLRGRGYEMLRPTLDDIPDLPVPDGLALRELQDDEPNRRRIFDAMADAFQDHRAEPEASEADWRQFRDDAKQDAGLWVMAFEGEELAGGAIGRIDDELIAHHAAARGYIDGVFTRRAWRRRGLARAALAGVLVRLRDRGMASAFLEVDGLNPNQAMDLYESLGFAEASTSADWIKPLPDDHRKDPRT